LAGQQSHGLRPWFFTLILDPPWPDNCTKQAPEEEESLKKTTSKPRKARLSAVPGAEETIIYLDKTDPEPNPALRSRAEEKFAILPKRKTVTGVDAEKLVHELQVHQIELEMQNDELQQAIARVEEMRGRYADLYDFSPAGHVTLDHSGIVIEANQTITLLMGHDKDFLLQKPFLSFVYPEAKDAFSTYFRTCISSEHCAAIETIISRKDNTFFHAQVETMGFRGKSNPPRQFLLAIFDITERKKIEAQNLVDAEDLRDSRVDLVRFNRAAVDRELRMIELKKEVNELCQKHGEPRRYEMGFLDGH
jgi:PAS domain S-box-containing protein